MCMLYIYYIHTPFFQYKALMFILQHFIGNSNKLLPCYILK